MLSSGEVGIMPEWLMKESNTRTFDRDPFLDKSIIGLLSMLSRLRSNSEQIKSGEDINAALKVLFTILFSVMISASKNHTFTVTAGVFLLVLLSLMSGLEIRKILKVSLAVSIFTFIIILPSAFFGNSYSTSVIPSKVFLTVTAVSMLSASTRWNEITAALKTFFVPDLFIMVLDITMKYILLLGEFSLNMFYALKMRTIGRIKGKTTALSGIAGTMFLKSVEMAEDMHNAMRCRGYTGEYQVKTKFRWKNADLLYLAANLSLIFIFFYLERK